MNKLCVFFRIFFLSAVIVLTAACSAAPVEENTEGSESNPFLVSDAAALRKVGSNSNGWTLDAHYRQTADIDLASVEWTSIGSSAAFSGSFDGNGFIIKNLFIDNDTAENQGLFGNIRSAALKNIRLENVSVKGGQNVGGIAGLNEYGSIQNCYVSGAVEGSNYVGGIVGHNNSGSVENCYAAGSVTGGSNAGGITGYNEYRVIKNCYAVSSVTGADYIGGVTGDNAGQVYNCYAAGNVTGFSYVGGIAGQTREDDAELLNCVALNPAVRSSDTIIPPRTGRVSGLDEDYTLSSNYAREDMILEDSGEAIPLSNEDRTSEKHGEGITETQWENSDWWNDESIWDGNSPWDFDSVWVWKEETDLPVLRNAGGTQDHTLE